MSWSTIFLKNTAWPALERKQEEVLKRVKENPAERFLLVSEPAPTFTFGRTASPSDCLWSKEELRTEGNRGIPRFTRRKMDVSRTGPDHRLSCGEARKPWLPETRDCPIPRRFPRGHSCFSPCQGSHACVRSHEGRAVRHLCRREKLASFGIAVRDGICSHGVALYLRGQSRAFAGINPCGVPDAETIARRSWMSSGVGQGRGRADGIH